MTHEHTMRATVRKSIVSRLIIIIKSIHFSSLVNSPHQPGCNKPLSRRAGNLLAALPVRIPSSLLGALVFFLTNGWDWVISLNTSRTHDRSPVDSQFRPPLQSTNFLSLQVIGI